jgi:hypothetical protein
MIYNWRKFNENFKDKIRNLSDKTDNEIVVDLIKKSNEDAGMYQLRAKIETEWAEYINTISQTEMGYDGSYCPTIVNGEIVDFSHKAINQDTIFEIRQIIVDKNNDNYEIIFGTIAIESLDRKYIQLGHYGNGEYYIDCDTQNINDDRGMCDPLITSDIEEIYQFLDENLGERNKDSIFK